MQSIKSLLVTLLILGGAFLAYDYYQAPHADKMVFKDSLYPLLPTAPAAPKPAEKEPLKGPAAIAEAAPIPSAPIVTINPPAPAKAPERPKAPPAFTPPPIPDVAQATQAWTRIPATAFPRQAKLSKPVAFASKFGSSQIPAGSEVTVLAAQNGVLTVAPNAQSALRASVPIDSTNLKMALTAAYDTWRARRIEEARLASQVQKVTPVVVDEASFVSSDGRPVQASDGTYPLLLASMKAGQVTEVTPHSIRRWGSPEEGKFNGQSCWVLAIEYDAQTAFGKISSAALAKVVAGKVAGWFYKGSEEPVP